MLDSSNDLQNILFVNHTALINQLKCNDIWRDKLSLDNKVDTNVIKKINEQIQEISKEDKKILVMILSQYISSIEELIKIMIPVLTFIITVFIIKGTDNMVVTLQNGLILVAGILAIVMLYTSLFKKKVRHILIKQFLEESMGNN